MRLFAVFLACALGWAAGPARADDAPDIMLTLFPERRLEAGTPVRVVAQMAYIGNKQPVIEDALRTIDGHKFHLVLVDHSMTDLQHVYPAPTATPGSYLFTFTPEYGHNYRAWADIVLLATGKRHYAVADFGMPRPDTPLDNTESYTAEAGGYRFGLFFHGVPVGGRTLVGNIMVTDEEGRLATRLGPDAILSIFGIYNDYDRVLTGAPAGTGRGTLPFQIKPPLSGFLRLFFQMRIDEQEFIVPFGVEILPVAD